MSKLLPTLLAAFGICCFCCSDFGLYTKLKAAVPAEKDRPSGATRIALVDMAAVFKRSTLFEQKREMIKVKIKDTEEVAQRMIKQMQQAANNLQTLENGSEERKSLEAQLKRQQAEFEEFRKAKAADFLKEESHVYREVYVIVANAVAEYAKEHDIDLVMRTNSEDMMAEQDPQKLLQALNRQVVYENNLDITEAVIEAVNHQ